ncbi:MAG: prolipoprotein diacylglyceryl transferase [Candidatus Moranbacteria bacterium RIFCSPHIGHO2_01_FULL_55_24]|nr:MAG: prolipoprotein diacylglyceryl transferase [Candidatus Moranbacteria bacterium RIFCSPHIGHO2_01_FULL_55_24]
MDLGYWQSFPERIDPVAFALGSFPIHWYAIFFLCGWAGAFLIALSFRRNRLPEITRSRLEDLFWWLLLGAALGARLGYALFYYPDLFLVHPFSLFSPYDRATGEWTGISGLSFHGGIIGVGAVLFLFSKKYHISFLALADLLALAAPAVSFFGRIGNFLNGELFGRVTEIPWGMYFSGERVLRHPSALYEAFFEGILLFVFLFFARKRVGFPGGLAALYVSGYGVLRFIAEFFREPDPQLGYFFGIFTLGQLFSLVLAAGGTILFFWFQRRKYATIRVN